MSEGKKSPVYVEHLRTNLKGIQKRDLGQFTLIVGRNGSGKSALVDSLSLVLTGRARTPGLGKSPKILIGMKPSEAEELQIEATLSGGDRISWKCGGGKVEHGGVALPAGMVTDALAGLLLGSGASVAKAVVQAVGGMVGTQEILSEVPVTLHEYLKESFPEVFDEDGGKGLCLVTAAEKMSEKRLALSRRVKAARVQEEVLPLSEDELAELKKLKEELPVLEAVAELSVNEKTAGKGLLLSAIHREGLLVADQLGTERSGGSQEEIDRLERAAEFVRGIGELKARVLELTSKLEIRCPLCSTPDLDRGVFSAGEEAVRQEEIEERLDQVREVVNRREKAKQRIALLKAMKALLHRQEQKEFQPARLKQAQGRVTELERRQQVALWQEGGSTVQSLQREADDAESIGKTFERMLGEAADRAALVVEKRMNRRLPSTIRVKIRKQGRQDLVVEADVRKEGVRPFRALSGAERASVAVAFASSAIPDEAPPVRLVLLDEVAMDPSSVRGLTKSFSRSSEELEGIQVVLTALTFTGKAPEGWTVIKLGGKEDGE